MILLVGGLLGLSAVALGAYAEHGLRPEISAEAFHAVNTAIRYHLWHAILVVAVGIALLHPGFDRYATMLRRVAWLFVAGTVMFSFAIYLSALWGLPALSGVTPLGGMLLMAGWLGLAWIGLKSLIGRDAG